MKVQEYKTGEVTAFLALFFMLLVAFTGNLMESASIQSAKCYRRADMNRAVECVFAEYQRELLQEFDIFSLDATYETGNFDTEKVMDRLVFYGATGMDEKVGKLRLLTDQNGEAFEEQIARYMKDKYGMSSIGTGVGDENHWRQQENASESSFQNQQEVSDELQQMIVENELELPVENNPLPNMNSIMTMPLVDLVMPENAPVSSEPVELEQMPSRRPLRKGYGEFEPSAHTPTLSNTAMGEYVLTHFSRADEARENSVGLAFETEYILSGKSTDRSNLEAVLQKILALRIAANEICLQADAGRQAEARALAVSLCAAMAFPAAIEVLTQILLFAWAFGESIVELRGLMRGYHLSLIKTSDQWQLSLQGLMNLGTRDGVFGEDQGELGYQEFLRILLLLQAKGKTCARALDMIEHRLRVKKSLAWFRADNCINDIEVESTAQLRRGIQYQFNTTYGYK